MNEVSIAATPAHLALSNFAYCSYKDYDNWSNVGPFVRVLSKDHHFFAYKYVPDESLNPGQLALNQTQRLDVYLALGEKVPFEVLGNIREANLLVVSVDFKLKKKRASATVINPQEFISAFKNDFVGQPFAPSQKIQFKFLDQAYIITVQVMTAGKEVLEENGMVGDGTELQIKTASSDLKLTVGASTPSSMPMKGVLGQRQQHIPPPPIRDVALAELGVGGLGGEFRYLLRKAFMTRCLHPDYVTANKVKHTKGILLYGPPGTGKTLLARTIAQMLNCKDIKKISGSEILSKWVGVADERIRELFSDAEEEFKEKGNYSDLHVVIIDEMDSICRQRASTTSGVGDTVVNQLLAKMDGVDEINNILLIGMTNRKDLLDKALLRPGRFSCLLEVGLPDEAGRLEILSIHTKPWTNSTPKQLCQQVDLAHYASLTKNFSGAELGDLCSNAHTFALERNLKINADGGYNINQADILVTKEDFEKSFNDCNPSFGLPTDALEQLLPQCGFITYNQQLQNLLDQIETHLNVFKNSPVLRLFSMLLYGPPGSGKTTIATHIAVAKAKIPHVKLVLSEEFVGMNESEIAGRIASVFKDCYKSPTSLLVLDNIERLISYSPLGPRFYNMVLQALVVYITKNPPKNRRVFIIATTSSKEAMSTLGLNALFHQTLSVPLVSKTETIQSVLLDVETARHSLSPVEFKQKLMSLGAPFEPLLYAESN